MVHTLQKLSYNTLYYKIEYEQSYFKIDLDAQHDLFETGVLEASDTQPASAGVDIRQHDPTTLSYHMPPSNRPPDSTTLSTFSEATAENSGTCTPDRTCTPDGTESDVELCTEFVRKTCECVKANGKPCSTLFTLEHYIEHRSLASLLT